MVQETYVMLKPDAYRRNLIGEIISRIEKKGLKIIGLKMIRLEGEVVFKHYEHLKSLDEFPRIRDYMLSGPVVAMAVKGEEAIFVMRNLVGPADGSIAPAGTIRGDYAINKIENIIHCSDSEEAAKIEIDIFFGNR